MVGINPLYSELEVTDLVDLNRTIEECNKTLVEQSEHVTDEEWINFEETIGDDIAKVMSRNESALVQPKQLLIQESLRVLKSFVLKKNLPASMKRI